MIKVLMACLGLEPWAAGWYMQMNPLSYGVSPISPIVITLLPIS